METTASGTVVDVIATNIPSEVLVRGKRLRPIEEGWEEGGKSSTEMMMDNVEDIMRAIVEFVIIDGKSFKAVEGEGFKKLMAKAFPSFELPSPITVARYCLKIYGEEKEKLKNLIKNQRVCLTSNTWTSVHKLTYMVVTAHWIDDEWNQQRKILNFFQIPDQNSKTIAKGIEACLLDWGIENLFTVTVDNATDSDVAIEILKTRIEDWKGQILGNEFLHVRCNADILNLIVKEGLDEQIESISRVRNAVKYAKSSPSRFASFKSYAEKTKIDTHSLLCLDVETRWNSTYAMLDRAVKFERAFTRMYMDEDMYQEYCLEISETGGSPSADDWKNVKAFIKFLDIFHQTTLKFSGSLLATSDSFFHEYFNLRNAIINYTRSEDLVLIDMAKRMKGRFDKYWGEFENMNMLLFVAIVLDPRYKLKYVNFVLTKSYDSLIGRLKSDEVLGVLTRLYNHYNDSLSEASNDNIGDDTSMMSEVGDSCQSRWKKHLENERNSKKSDLEKYLMDDLVKAGDLNILAWWKDSSSKYPVLSKIARDVLSIPISTVAYESAFSTGDRILDSFQSSLPPKMLEALVCTQQWLRSPSKESKVEEEYPGSPLSII